MSDPKVLFSALFEPQRIALIGASSDVTKTTSRPQRFLRKHGFTGEILPVNPSRSEILGEKAYKDLDAIPGDIDHAYILLNGKAAVRGARGVRHDAASRWRRSWPAASPMPVRPAPRCRTIWRASCARPASVWSVPTASAR